MDGKEMWRTNIGGETDASTTYWPDKAKPLIVCTGLWGDAIALDVDGKIVWRHHFRSKNRARPLIADADGDGDTDLVIAAYNQHVYAFDRGGACIDDVRVAGSVNASPVAVPNSRGGNDIIVVSTTLQAHRFSPAPARATYGGEPDRRGRIFVQQPTAPGDGALDAIVLDNPSARFARVNVSTTDRDGTHLFSRLSSADPIVARIPDGLRARLTSNNAKFSVNVTDADGSTLLQRTVSVKARDTGARKDDRVRVWATPAYAPLDARAEHEAASNQAVRIGPLYLDEIDQGAFVIQNGGPKPIDARIELDVPTRAVRERFTGSIALLQLKVVPTLNGEEIADALVPVAENAVDIAAGESLKVWVQADAHGAAPGVYESGATIRFDYGGPRSLTVPVTIAVDSLRLPPQPLTMCTWDYVPNKWFPENTQAVLEDMQRHDVNIFPRTTVPKATYDGQRLIIDCSNLDDELARIHGRGTLLLQVAAPPIDFGAHAPADPRPMQIEYLLALRDYLFAKGWGYETWALYPVDEPGLDYGGNAQRQVEAGELFRAADPKMRIYTDPVPGLSQRDYERIAPYVDVWCPNMRLVSGLLVNDARMTAIRDSGKPVWSYECVSQVRSLSPLRYNRANAWRADHFGIDGIGFWTHSTTQVDPWIADTTKNDEYALVYPGPLPVSSVRWEAARDGIEDVGAMRVLEDAIEKARAASPRARAITNAEDVLRRVRSSVMEMADEAYVESRDFLKQGDRQIQHTWWDAQAFIQYREEIAEATHALKPATK
ncbi:MAG: DUF4091 domain-containing protein [Candidatus Hydrogenedentes bacterium]|nr:DUF4091 domain-containing protein [Candidatus Hydrogenedentota bacterium]